MRIKKEEKIHTYVRVPTKKIHNVKFTKNKNYTSRCYYDHFLFFVFYYYSNKGNYVNNFFLTVKHFMLYFIPFFKIKALNKIRFQKTNDKNNIFKHDKYPLTAMLIKKKDSHELKSSKIKRNFSKKN